LADFLTSKLKKALPAKEYTFQSKGTITLKIREEKEELCGVRDDQ